MKKRVSWSSQILEVHTVERFDKELNGDLFYQKHDYDDFEQDLIEEELSLMEEEECLEAIAAAVNRWMGSAPDVHSSSTEERECDSSQNNNNSAPSRPRRRQSLERKAPSLPARRRSIEMPPPMMDPQRSASMEIAPRRPTRRVSVQSSPPAPPSRNKSSTSGSTLNIPPNRPNRRVSVEITPPSRPDRRMSIDVPLSALGISIEDLEDLEESDDDENETLGGSSSSIEIPTSVLGMGCRTSVEASETKLLTSCQSR